MCFRASEAGSQDRQEARATPSLAATFCADVKVKIRRLQQEIQRRDESIANLHVQLQQKDDHRTYCFQPSMTFFLFVIPVC
jgi:hypothetical protein